MEDDFAWRMQNEQATLMDLRKEIETHIFLCQDKDRQNTEVEAEI